MFALRKDFAGVRSEIARLESTDHDVMVRIDIDIDIGAVQLPKVTLWICSYNRWIELNCVVLDYFIKYSPNSRDAMWLITGLMPGAARLLPAGSTVHNDWNLASSSRMTWVCLMLDYAEAFLNLVEAGVRG